jgi:hypothetical protein
MTSSICSTGSIPVQDSRNHANNEVAGTARFLADAAGQILPDDAIDPVILAR